MGMHDQAGLGPGSDRWLRTLGGTGLDVTAITVGGAPLGSMPHAFGYTVAADDAVALVRAVLESPIQVIDTSNGYSDGESERRIGAGIAQAGGLAAGRLVVTKVDPDGSDYSGRRVRKSVEDSKARLGLDFLPLVHLHDPEFHPFAELTAPGGAVDTLVQLRDEGVIGHIGVAGGDTRILSRYLDLEVFEVLLVHNRLTLVDRSATALVERARGDGLGIINAAIYGGGILADPLRASRQYGYRDAPEATLRAIEQMADACSRAGTDLATAALQFSLRDERVDTTVVGISKVTRLDGLLSAAGRSLPDSLWEELEDLVPDSSTWLDAD